MLNAAAFLMPNFVGVSQASSSHARPWSGLLAPSKPSKPRLLSPLSRFGNARRVVRRAESEEPIRLGTLDGELLSSKDWRRSLAILTEMREDKTQPSAKSYEAALYALAVSLDFDSWEWSLRLLEEMKDFGLKPSKSLHDMAIAGIATGRKWQHAVALLREMEELKFEKTEVSYKNTLMACVKGRKWTTGLELLEEMQTDGFELDAKSRSLLEECVKAKGRFMKNKFEKPPTLPLEDENGKPTMTVTSVVNARRYKGKAVPVENEGLSTLVKAEPLVPITATRGPLARGKPIKIPGGLMYSKELRVLEYVLQEATRGDPFSVCEAIENFGDHVLVKGKAKLWLKIAGGVKTDVLTAAMAGGPLGDEELQTSVLEVGCYMGYSSTRMSIALPGVHIASLEVDPVHVVIARNVHLVAGLQGTIDVWTGHSKEVVPRMLSRYGGKGHLKFGAAFFDQKGSRYGEDMDRLWAERLLHPGAVLVADNVLKPGAPLFLYQIVNGGYHEAQIVSMDEFAMPSEDWMSINVRKKEFHKKVPRFNETEPPEFLYELEKETDRIRDRAVGPGRSVDYGEWADFAQMVKAGLKKANVELTLDLRPKDGQYRDAALLEQYEDAE